MARDFSITTGGGEDFTVDARRTELEGDAWVDVYTVALDGEILDLEWTTELRWRTEVSLDAGENELSLVAFDVDGNIVGSDSITVTAMVEAPRFIRGDFDLDGMVELGDAVRILAYLYRGVATSCHDAGDVNDDEVLNTADAIQLLDFLYENGAAPEAPFPDPGWEREDEGPLGCAAGL